MIHDLGRLRRTFYTLRTEGEGPGRDAAAIGLGTFIGCTPLYGCHLALCWIAGRLLRLNRLKLYFAANISNPLVSPFLIFAELQTGAWIRRGHWHALTLETVRRVSPWTFAGDLIVGSLVVGMVLGLATAAATSVTGGWRHRRDPLAPLWRRASDLYFVWSIVAWEFARGKLRGDPVYRAIVAGGVVDGGDTLVDIGCGQGLALAALRQAEALATDGRWPMPAGPPRFRRLVGIELRPRVAALARRALGEGAEVIAADARAVMPEACDVVLFLDVLHMLDARAQEAMLERAIAALKPGGRMVVREADAHGGWQFSAVRAGNRVKALATGNWRQRFCFRPIEEWAALLARYGLEVRVEAAGGGTPFANALICATRLPRGAALHEPPDMDDRRRRPPARVEVAAKPQRAGNI
ncbi:MAG TPA: DUF2062 domain-containing protein [Vicinamibacterales bacterium]|nr:DUF2062 domain-containing protein [Vicinamibacterales bacterium]